MQYQLRASVLPLFLPRFCWCCHGHEVVNRRLHRHEKQSRGKQASTSQSGNVRGATRAASSTRAPAGVAERRRRCKRTRALAAAERRWDDLRSGCSPCWHCEETRDQPKFLHCPCSSWRRQGRRRCPKNASAPWNARCCRRRQR